LREAEKEMEIFGIGKIESPSFFMRSERGHCRRPRAEAGLSLREAKSRVPQSALRMDDRVNGIVKQPP